VRAPSGNPKKVLETPGKLGDMAISPNSENLVFLGATSYNDPLAQSIYTVPLKGGKANLLTPDFKESFVAVDWVDDNTILGKSYRGTKTVLSTINTKGKSQEGMANQILRNPLLRWIGWTTIRFWGNPIEAQRRFFQQ